jgi:hypothetical protein
MRDYLLFAYSPEAVKALQASRTASHTTATSLFSEVMRNSPVLQRINFNHTQDHLVICDAATGAVHKPNEIRYIEHAKKFESPDLIARLPESDIIYFEDLRGRLDSVGRHINHAGLTQGKRSNVYDAWKAHYNEEPPFPRQVLKLQKSGYIAREIIRRATSTTQIPPR